MSTKEEETLRVMVVRPVEWISYHKAEVTNEIASPDQECWFLVRIYSNKVLAIFPGGVRYVALNREMFETMFNGRDRYTVAFSKDQVLPFEMMCANDVIARHFCG